ncbi:hypothetical protein DQ04_00981080 [Trypanosoma grayi]|uniref:hypothetical protein n=1 Tax=Trypanosoma grayi TaxID=71804 RepID=UPI0004F47BA5|nr:hypothetical protein DQ04_00981080 [Trypanosoma grayi]KEG13478.1 hypothetical protein DQ04_00981080 [Trypanosoma grayi]
MLRDAGLGKLRQQHRVVEDLRTPPPRREAPAPPPLSPDSSPAAVVAAVVSYPPSSPLRQRVDAFESGPCDFRQASNMGRHASNMNSKGKNSHHSYDDETLWRRELLQRERELEEREEEFNALVRLQHAAYTERLQEISRKEKTLLEWEQRLRGADGVARGGGDNADCCGRVAGGTDVRTSRRVEPPEAPWGM